MSFLCFELKITALMLHRKLFAHFMWEWSIEFYCMSTIRNLSCMDHVISTALIRTTCFQKVNKNVQASTLRVLVRLPISMSLLHTKLLMFSLQCFWNSKTVNNPLYWTHTFNLSARVLSFRWCDKCGRKISAAVSLQPLQTLDTCISISTKSLCKAKSSTPACFFFFFYTSEGDYSEVTM